MALIMHAGAGAKRDAVVIPFFWARCECVDSRAVLFCSNPATDSSHSLCLPYTLFCMQGLEYYRGRIRHDLRPPMADDPDSGK